MHRIGTLPFDMRDDAVALLFVTSQTRGRWILPKGLAKQGETHAQTCAREAFEEAGINGVVMEDFPITVPITKKTDEGTQAVPVTYYPMLVRSQADDWPEQDSRERHWALMSDASKVAFREDYLGLIHQFEQLMPWIKEAAAAHK